MDLLLVQLVRPAVSFEQSFVAGFQELETDSDRSAWVYLGNNVSFLAEIQNFPAYVAKLLKRETEAPPNFVCDTVYWAVVLNDVVGRIAIRHELNDFLRTEGGHIGFIVRPSWRRRGVACEMLRHVLLTERAQKIETLLLTCDDGNVASERAILKNGGQYESSIQTDSSRPPKKRFWIHVSR